MATSTADLASFAGWPVVLVNLDTVTHEQLFELIEDAWRLQAAKRVVAAYDAEQ